MKSENSLASSQKLFIWLSWVRWIQFAFSQPIYLRSILMWPSNLGPGHSNDISLQVFWIKFCIPQTRATWLLHLFVLLKGEGENWHDNQQRALSSLWRYTRGGQNNGNTRLVFLIFLEWVEVDPLFGLLYQPWIIYDVCEAVGVMRIGSG
jgi:hypothetical protein